MSFQKNLRNDISGKTDFYKLTHHLQYIDGLNSIMSYGEMRPGAKYPYGVFAGFLPIVKDLLEDFIVCPEIMRERVKIWSGGHDYYTDEVFKKVKDLGYVPVRIRAVAEGSIVPIDNALFTIESTADWFAKVANSLESNLLHVWYPSTIATRSAYIFNSIKPLMEKTGGEFMLPYALNDFGYRGGFGHEAAIRAGMAHFLFFSGSDNCSAGLAITDYYGDEKDPLFSVWATEHSVATSFGLELEEEIEYILHQINKAPDNAIISIVIDSNDPRRFMEQVVSDSRVKSKIIERAEAGGRTVFRPDSGVPEQSIEMVLNISANIFGYHYNEKGYKVLNHNVGVLQGDGIDETAPAKLYEFIISNGWCTSNLIFGSGGGLHTGVSRDTQNWAVKACYGEKIVDHEYVMKTQDFTRRELNQHQDIVGFGIQKKTSSKPSKFGKVKLTFNYSKNITSYSTITNATADSFDAYVDAMVTYYENGIFKYNESFQTIRERAQGSIAILNK